ncbi:uncharacterized protein LOC129584313 [Paramacrobiotus metropolitanus]|uniref:uncharacterized protein LOC129584313 n=1 Tax=Paramacrobiotus metropolitanus TaxID=2943436 RepID=UPI00244640B4|nr:uncharacterized protein LOC129584313 [Paramacrobiotus metropolitanus]
MTRLSFDVLIAICWMILLNKSCKGSGMYCWDCGRLPDYPIDKYIPCRFNQEQLSTPDQCHPSARYCLTADISPLDESAEPYYIQQCSRSCTSGSSVDRARNVRVTTFCCQDHGCNTHSGSSQSLPGIFLIFLGIVFIRLFFFGRP